MISTGPYAYVRHPMYATALVMMLGMPIALGSLWGLLALAMMLPALVWRMVDEEKFLATGLPGYAEYKQKVRYRLIPHLCNRSHLGTHRGFMATPMSPSILSHAGHERGRARRACG